MEAAKQPAEALAKPAVGSPAAKAAADMAANAMLAGRRLKAAREGRDRVALGACQMAVAEQRSLQLQAKRPESMRVRTALEAIKALEAGCGRMQEEEWAAADAGGDHLLKAVELQRKRAEAVSEIAALKEQRLGMMLEDETRLKDAERQQHALEKLELEYVELKATEKYAEAYQLSVMLKDLRSRLSVLWHELTGGAVSEALMGVAGPSAEDEADIEAGMQPTIPAPFSFADHAAVLLAGINKSRRKIKMLERVVRTGKSGPSPSGKSGGSSWIDASDTDDSPVMVNPQFALEAERLKLKALQTRLAERYAAKSKKESALRPSPMAFGVSASRFSADTAREGGDSLSEDVFKEVMRGAAAAAAARRDSAASVESESSSLRKPKRRKHVRSRAKRRMRLRPVPPSLAPTKGEAAKSARSTAVRLGAGSLSPFGFASATPTYRGAASKGVPWGIKEIDRPSLIRDAGIGQPAPRTLRSQQYAALLLDPEFQPGDRPTSLFPDQKRPAMGVLFKEKARAQPALTRYTAGTLQQYTWNPAPPGVAGVDVSKWNADGSRVEEGNATAGAKKKTEKKTENEDEHIIVPKITRAKPSWAWAGAKGQKPLGALVEQWFTEMDSVVDDMFEAVTPAESEGVSASFEDATLLGRSRTTTGIVGVRRRNGFVKRHAGLPLVPFVAFTLLRQPTAEDLAAAAKLGSGSPLSAESSVVAKSPESLSARDGAHLSGLLHPAPPAQQAHTTKATAWTDQSSGDGWVEDTATVVWHVAGFDQMTYNKSYSLQSTKELGFSEMSFMCNPKLSAHDERMRLAKEASDAFGGGDRPAVSPRGALAQSDMMTSSGYYRYSARGTMLNSKKRGPLGESVLARAVVVLRAGMRSAAFDAGADDLLGLFNFRYRLKADEPMGYWELVHVVRKSARLTETELSDVLLMEIFMLIRDTHDEQELEESSDEEEYDDDEHIQLHGKDVDQAASQIQARYRGNQLRKQIRTGADLKAMADARAAAEEESRLLGEALAGHPGAGSAAGASFPAFAPAANATTVTPRQLMVFLRTWMWRTLAFDLGWRLHEVGFLQ